MPITLATLNIQAAAQARATRLLPWLLDRRADIWVLTETSAGPGTTILAEGLAAAGYQIIRPEYAARDRGVMVASRVPAVARDAVTASVSLPGRAVVADLGTDPAVLLVGVYVPSSDRAPDKVQRKRSFLSSLLDALDRLDGADRARLVLCGDYNVIGRDHLPRYRAFLAFEYEFIDALSDLGLQDVLTQHYPPIQAYSWIGRGGNGYRFDYIHMAKQLCPWVTDCGYVHEPRLSGLTDHAAVTVTIDATLPAATYPASTAPTSRSRES